jgi:hypothetical protein
VRVPAPSLPAVQASNGRPVMDVDKLVEEIWCELEGQVAKPLIYQVATEVAGAFEQAKVRAYVPILVRRYTLERLRTRLKQERKTV